MVASFLPFLKRPPRIAVIRLQGEIRASGRGLNDAALAPLLTRAFRAKPKAVALLINSPGGSPVQSALIAARIRRLAQEHKVPVYGFVEDIAASGGYWLATAADEIYADPSSMIGSIGVIFAGFGFSDLIARHGVERRVHTAGRSKSLADPFKPETETDAARIQALLGPLHQNFIAHVTARRGARLDRAADLFNADVWLGAEAQALGLIDGLDHLEPKMKALFGEKVRFVHFGQKRSLLQRFGWGASAQGWAGEMLASAEERGLWARYGL